MPHGKIGGKNHHCPEKNAEVKAARRVAKNHTFRLAKGEESSGGKEPVKKRRTQRLEPAPRVQDIRRLKKKCLEKEVEEAHTANLHKLARKRSQVLKEEARERAAAKERARLEAEKLAEEIEAQLSSKVSKSSITGDEVDSMDVNNRENESNPTIDIPATGKRRASGSPKKRMKEGTRGTRKRTRTI
ncbi:hypothetical protein BGZ60DRAFT_434755 [Tricladium varicosporioides]|nr:hypothetical protein BGZ60DRAFT_434755 [Hymenoscyphus varicosporioides]